MREIPAGWGEGEMVAGVSPVALLHEAFETTSVGMVMLDLQGDIRHANSACCDIFGHTVDELVGRSFLSLKHPDDRQAVQEHMELLQRGEQDNFRAEKRSLSKGGSVLWVHISASLIRGRDGLPHAVVAVVEDVTRQRVIEEARRELHTEREALLDSAAEGIYGVDLHGDCTFVNRAAAEMFGYTRDEMLGRNMHALVHAKYPDGRSYPVEECVIAQAFHQPRSSAQKLRDYEQTLWHKDGTPIPVEHSAEAVMVDGEVRGTVVTLRDVTGRNARRAERQSLLDKEQTSRQRAEVLNGALENSELALREALQEQLQLMEAIPQMVWVTGPEGEPKYVNERWRAFTGGNRGSDAQGWLATIHPEDREQTAKCFADSLHSGATYEMEHRMRCADGSYRWVLARARPLRDASGKIVRWFGTSTDVHDRKIAEELLRRTEKLAAAGRLAATVAHEINNPLEAVANLLYLSQHEDGIPPAAARYLQTASEELRRVGHVVSQTLAFYRDSNAPQHTDLSTLVSDVLDLYQRKLDGRRIRVSRNLETGVEAEALTGELRQVVANLMSNAIDSMESNGVLGVEVRAQNDEASIVISDTGHGIGAPILEHIFEPFFTTKKEIGTGLGLWVSKGIVEKHHGRIEVVSSEADNDHGTAFIITLPRLASC